MICIIELDFFLNWRPNSEFSRTNLFEVNFAKNAYISSFGNKIYISTYTELIITDNVCLANFSYKVTLNKNIDISLTKLSARSYIIGCV